VVIVVRIEVKRWRSVGYWNFSEGRHSAFCSYFEHTHNFGNL
jgi:hypothetical protein